mmetsp:Transcript_39122/g.74969  ORF Transcript_39122/g.74969 Transcript_39122/m.74969 type:complete len:274 (-) Transcript_39122:310-1131(-)|eukprot:CAMPEP_0114253306 /NCGR_PEP_ID=MMETSP0058-20121206/16316_1 /TAXON_ID=36894 /ORGANISM="Pyramimonas parkeae, CCMP726" /LENGTH=273 /DNA_ID=CAMNT_0001367331 /DNA_START=255 /DNA_END=1076 /DNA_ORIENTATION=+
MLGTDRTDRTERVLCKCSTNCEQSRANDAGFSLDLSEETGHCVDVLPRNSCESERAGRVIEPVWPPRISDLERGRSEDNWVAADVSRAADANNPDDLLQEIERPSPRVSSEEDETPECRICKEEEGHMLSPCACQGSLRWVHAHCLQEWILKRQVAVEIGVCEICNTPYNIQIRQVLHCDSSTLCSRASWAFYFEFSTVMMCLISLAYIFVLSRTQPKNSDDENERTSFDAQQPTAIIVLCIGTGVALFTIFTLCKMFLLWKRTVSSPEIVFR